MHNKAFPYILILGFFWGSNLVASRFGVGQFHPLLFISIRLLAATACFVLIILIAGQPITTDRKVWGYSMISGVLGIAIPMSFFFFALQFMSSGMASIFVTAAPALVAIAAHLFLPDEPLTRLKGLGVTLALGGSVFLALQGETGLASGGQLTFFGPTIILIGMLSDTGNVILVRKRMQGMDPFSVTAIRLLTGAIVTTLAVTLFVGFDFSQVTAAGWFTLAYATLLGAVAGQFLAFYITKQFGATAFSLTAFVIPVVATIMGVLFLDELITSGMLIGVILIGSGIYFINRKPASQAAILKPER